MKLIALAVLILTFASGANASAAKRHHHHRRHHHHHVYSHPRIAPHSASAPTPVVEPEEPEMTEQEMVAAEAQGQLEWVHYEEVTPEERQEIEVGTLEWSVPQEEEGPTEE